jgi:hypothetical protein
MSNFGPGGPGPASDPWEHSAPALADLDLGYPQQHQQPESTSSKALLAVLVTVLVIVLCGGGVAALYLIGNRGGGQHSGSGASSSPSLDPNTIAISQCIVNEGTEDKPKLRVVACGPNAYQVIGKIPNTYDKDRCKEIPGATQAFFYKALDPAQSFVLCLKSGS